MKRPAISIRRGRRTGADDAVVDQGLEDGVEAPPIESPGGMVATTMTGRLMSFVVAGALVAGPIGLAVALTKGGTAPAVAAPPAPVVIDSPDQGRIGEFAVAIVKASVEAAQGRKVPAWVPGEVGTAQRGMRVDDPAVVAATHAPAPGGEAWSVTIAATITAAKGAAVRRHFLVPVLRGPDGQLQALGGMSLVAATAYGQPGRLAYDELVTAGPARDAVTGFLAALLTGDGDITRYVAPGTAITAVTPPPFTRVDLVALTASRVIEDAPADRAQVQVLVAASGVVSSAEELPLSYALTLTVRAGRWEVSRLDLAPLVLAPESSGAAPDPLSPTGASTTTK